MSESFPITDLPVEIQGHIFQCAALEANGGSRVQLMLASKFVHDWVAEIHYHTIVILSLSSLRSFLKFVLGLREAAFLSSRVRALLIRVSEEGSSAAWIKFWSQVLPRFSQLRYLDVWDSFQDRRHQRTQPIFEAVVPTLCALPRLFYLGIHPRFLQASSGPLSTKFYQVTHLKLFDVSIGSISSILPSFPSVTHVMIPLEDFTLVGIIIRRATHSPDPVEDGSKVVTRIMDKVSFEDDIMNFKELVAGKEMNMWKRAEIGAFGRPI
ncbi:hypothetical protein DL96DRAFT_1629485 [Flagelloscypha sp. PMI_526]|nr:hypothetical protein DL96DRAFT_1629485 [Flagelloscypha sp. PMI_526]